MKVSVIIPTYNRGHVVGQAIESVLAQTYRNFEVLVVDDGSVDDTARRLPSWTEGGDRARRVRYLRRPHRGVAAARNAGVAAAAGSVVSFLDSDDLWKPDKLEHEVGFLLRHPDADAVFSDLEKQDGRLFLPSFMRASPVFARRLSGLAPGQEVVLSGRAMYLALLQEAFVKPSALTLRRGAFERAGGFDESWSSCEDWEFLLRFAKRARFGYIDRPLAVLRLSPDSLHRVDQPRGEAAMLALLAREREALQGDREARAAVERGLRERVKSFAWYYEGAGRRWRATGVFLRGFRVTGDPELLARAAVPWMPFALRRLARGLRRPPTDVWRGPEPPPAAERSEAGARLAAAGGSRRG